MSDMSPHHGRGTLAVHAGVEPDPTTGAIMTPVYLTSTYVQDGVGNHKGFEYSRTHNPTRSALEAAFAALEHGSHGLAFASGLAAMDTVLKTLQPGDEVISTNDLYGGSYRLFTTVFAHYGITFHFVDLGDLESLKAKLNEHTRLIWVETPTNPMMPTMITKPKAWPLGAPYVKHVSDSGRVEGARTTAPHRWRFVGQSATSTAFFARLGLKGRHPSFTPTLSRVRTGSVGRLSGMLCSPATQSLTCCDSASACSFSSSYCARFSRAAIASVSSLLLPNSCTA